MMVCKKMVTSGPYIVGNISKDWKLNTGIALEWNQAFASFMFSCHVASEL
jgi:hypothetical protein